MNEYELLFTTCELVAKQLHIKLVQPKAQAESLDLKTYINEIAQSTEIRVRKVKLNNDWWKSDCGPLLGFYQNQPCALLPNSMGGYKLIDLNQGYTIKVTEKIADKLQDQAYYFYPSLPFHLHGIKDLLKFSLQNLKIDLWLFVSIQILIGILSLAVPVAMAYLFDNVVPNADLAFLLEIILILLTNILIITLFSIGQAINMIRLRFKLESIISPAIWDRILKFPMKIFRHYAAGDLAYRAEIITDIQNTLTLSTLVSIINGFVSIFTLALLFYYNVPIAIAATALAVMIGLFNFYINSRQLDFMRRLYFHFGKLMSFVFEVLSGIEKIRVNDASSRVFNLWRKRLLKRTRAELGMKSSLLRLEVFTAVMSVINPLVLYGLVFIFKNKLTLGTFLAFNAAYTLLFMSILKMSSDMSEAVRIFPLWKRARPLITSKIEIESGHIDPGLLNGDILIKNIVFRYHPDDKPLFENLSLAVRPGEFIAIVGPSGSGKSTLFRLLLGFEEPQIGDIFFNGLNLKTLKLSSLRKQIGVVTQNSTLIPGTIFANIVGNSTELSRRDAWEIAEKVGLAELIKLLPMQMDTLISEGAITLSGGETQRLILARALAQKPKILILDEATSALDNTTQAVVHHYLKELEATQIIAAHRLSTIVNANRIYVLDKGSIVQTGTFESLMREPGLFSQLAKRQL